MIDKFQGEYRFLSNFWPCDVDYHLIRFPTVEHAYQAAKCEFDDAKTILAIRSAETPAKAKKLGKSVKLRAGWDLIKREIMLYLIKQKFTLNKHLKEKLLATNDILIVEGNFWHDNYWGDCNCAKCKDIIGENNLGKILMQVREELR